MEKLFRFRPRDGFMLVTSYIGEEEVVVIPDTNYSGVKVTGVSRKCFFKCDKKIRYKIKEIVIPNTVVLIEKEAFYDLRNLEKITLPYELRYIEQYAFRFCKKLKEITFHKNLKTIGNSAFSYCKSLKKITSLADKISVSKYAFDKCELLEDVSFNFIGSLEFYMQLKITIKLILKYDTLSIEDQKQLSGFISKKPKLKKSLFLSNEREVITILLDKIIKPKLPALNEYINHHIKQENTPITALLLEYKNNNFTQEKLKSYEENVELVELGFEFPTLTQLNKKWSVGKHENNIVITAYKGNNLHEEIPAKTKGGKHILYIGCSGEYALYDYLRLESLTLPEGLIEILNCAFINTRLENIYLPQSLTRIREYAFSGCRNLKEIVLPDNLEIIEYATFAHCNSLTEIIIPEKVKIISKYAFNSCINLEKIVLPDGLEIIEEKAFDGCENIKEIVILNPENITIECEFFKSKLEKRNLL